MVSNEPREKSDSVVMWKVEGEMTPSATEGDVNMTYNWWRRILPSAVLSGKTGLNVGNP